jgi:exonuclease SbcC
MSGGERTFIDACLTRAIALYLAQNTGRRFDTLFSDEADGPLAHSDVALVAEARR